MVGNPSLTLYSQYSSTYPIFTKSNHAEYRVAAPGATNLIQRANTASNPAQSAIPASEVEIIERSPDTEEYDVSTANPPPRKLYRRPDHPLPPQTSANEATQAGGWLGPP